MASIFDLKEEKKRAQRDVKYFGERERQLPREGLEYTKLKKEQEKVSKKREAAEEKARKKGEDIKTKRRKEIKKKLDKKMPKPKIKLGKEASGKRAVVDKGGGYSFFNVDVPEQDRKQTRVGNNVFFRRNYDTEKEAAKKWLLG